MASSSGNSTVSTKSQSYGSEKDLQLLMDQRKRKRKQSNRESARRSRMRKQKHMDDLIGEVERFRIENNEIMKRVSTTTQHYLKIKAENCVLRVQMGELSQRLQSLNDIISLINNNNNNNTTIGGIYQNDCFLTSVDNFMINPMNMLCLNQPIVASSADMFQW